MDGYFAEVVELPGCMTEADTLEELWPMIEDAKRGWIEVSLEHGDPIPEPRDFKDFSGKVNLRMPKSLHQDLARRAKEEGVSLNQFMITALARAVGRRRSGWNRVRGCARLGRMVTYRHVRVSLLREAGGRSTSCGLASGRNLLREL
ncbi:MAG: type II toxin-antitoxin system HicB family antitoxin [Actinomycetota bacterium]|nr:type II toxin-antitoxin system HicB family antitoxin [Actinomycetota bacterium]